MTTGLLDARGLPLERSRGVKLLDRYARPIIRDPDIRTMARTAAEIRAWAGTSTPPLSQNSQPLLETANTTTNASGVAVFTFDAPPQGSTWTGTVTCSNAPATAIFVATVGADQWGDWAGDSIAGPIQCLAGRQLVVTATGLIPSTDYLLTWTGASDPAGLPAPVWPDPTSSAQTVQFGVGTLVYNQANITGGFPITIPGIPPNTRTIILQVTIPNFSTPPIINLVGGTTNYQYYSWPAYLGGVTTFTTLTIVPFLGVADQSVLLTLSGGTTPYGVKLWADTAQYEESIFYNGPLYTASTGIGAPNSVTLLTGPARLLTYQVDSNATSIVQLGIAGSNDLFQTVNQGTTGSGSFPPNTLLRQGQSLFFSAAGAGQAYCSLGYTYP